MRQEIEVPLLEVHDEGSIERSKPKKVRSHFEKFLDPIISPLKYNTVLSFFKAVTFLDVWERVLDSYRSPSPLKPNELPLPHMTRNVEESIVNLDKLWQHELTRRKPSLAQALYKCFKKEIWKCGFSLAISVSGRLFATLLLGSMINIITQLDLNDYADQARITSISVLFCVIVFFVLFFTANYWISGFSTGSKIRLTLLGFLYKKLHSVSLSSLHDYNLHKVVNLLTTSLNEIDFSFLFVLPAYISPITLGLCGYFIWIYFQQYSLISMTLLVLAMFISRNYSMKTRIPRVQLNNITEKRIKITTELVEYIKQVKMYAWEKPLRKILENLRAQEENSMISIFRTEIFGRTFAESSVYLCVFAMCAVYTYNSGILSPAKVYTSFMLLAFTKLWAILYFQWSSVFLANAKVMQQRAEEILMIPDIITAEESVGSVQKWNKREPIIFKHFTAYWSKDAQRPCLEDITIKIEPGAVVALIGKIGSGKTSFLYSFLREIPVTSGAMHCKGSVAFVEQEPILFQGTIYYNIVFGREYDDRLYHKVLKACCLVQDLESLPKGDQTYIGGDRGAKITNSLKSKITIARAIYSQCDIYLFDDPFASLDAKIAKTIFDNVVRGELLEAKTVIMATQTVAFAKEADYIIVMNEGKIQTKGTFEELQSKNINFSAMLPKELKRVEEKQPEDFNMRRKISVQEKDMFVEEEFSFDVDDEEPFHITWEHYKAYLKASGSYFKFIYICVLYLLNHFTILALLWFLGYWAYEHHKYYNFSPQNDEPYNNLPYIIWGSIITLLLFLDKYSKVHLTMKLIVRTHTNMHTKMLRSLCRAMMQFFDKTPMATIISRFANDLGNADKQNWNTVYDALEGIAYFVLFILILIWISPFVAIPCLAAIYALLKIKRLFAKPTMDAKILEQVTRNPINNEIHQTLKGLIIIRVFNQGGRFIRTFMEYLYENTKAMQFSQRTTRLFTFLVDIVIYGLLAICCFIYIQVAFATSLHPGLFGLSITMLLELLNVGSSIVRQFVNVDISMQSINRMLDYTNLPEEAPEVRDKDSEVMTSFEGKWPSRGEIIFKNVFVKYRQDTGLALNGLDLAIKPGTRVGIVGRPGAGKSTIIQSLLRLTEIEERPDSAIKIDGVNIKDIGLELLRRSISVVPSTPAIFTGTIKRNLDPGNEFADDLLWEALEEVGLRQYVEMLPHRLDADITTSSSNILSYGQRIQLCLARAILRRDKIVVVDEVATNLDIFTDNLILSKINEKFKDCTLIMIAQRMLTVAHYDKVAVLEKGRVKEYDTPFHLLVNDDEDKRITRTDGLFAQMVMESGEENAKKIFEIARRTHMDKLRGANVFG